MQEKSDFEKEKERIEKQLSAKKFRYQGVFNTVQGRIVLLEILMDLGFFSRVNDEQDRILHNFAHDLAELSGGVTSEEYKKASKGNKK